MIPCERPLWLKPERGEKVAIGAAGRSHGQQSAVASRRTSLMLSVPLTPHESRSSQTDWIGGSPDRRARALRGPGPASKIR